MWPWNVEPVVDPAGKGAVLTSSRCSGMYRPRSAASARWPTREARGCGSGVAGLAESEAAPAPPVVALGLTAGSLLERTPGDNALFRTRPVPNDGRAADLALREGLFWWWWSEPVSIR